MGGWSSTTNMRIFGPDSGAFMLGAVKSVSELMVWGERVQIKPRTSRTLSIYHGAIPVPLTRSREMSPGRFEPEDAPSQNDAVGVRIQDSGFRSQEKKNH